MSAPYASSLLARELPPEMPGTTSEWLLWVIARTLVAILRELERR